LLFISRRMICFVCKTTKNHKFLRCLIYDLVYLSHTRPQNKYDFEAFITTSVRIWPEFLNWPSFTFCDSVSNVSFSSYLNDNESFEVTIKKNPVLCVIIFLVKHSLKERLKQNPDLLAYHYYVRIINNLYSKIDSFLSMFSKLDT
jgi:hypothetical protein